MSAFIVIGAHEQVKGLVDGISKCYPLNPIAKTVISSGTIVEKKNQKDIKSIDDFGNDIISIEEEISWWYEYNIFNGDNSEVNNDSSSKELNKLLSNQIAHLRTASQSFHSLNIFLIANLLSEKDLEKTRYACQEIKKVNDIEIQLFVIAIAYDLKNPLDVSIRPDSICIKKFLKEITDTAQYILYLSNKDLNHSAINITEGQLAEVLADYFMLLSNSGDSYNAFNSIGNKLFSIGYSSYKYEYSDFEKFIKLTHKRDLIDMMLNDGSLAIGNDLNSDFNNNPFSLKDRRKFLENRIHTINFNEDISQIADDNIFKLRNNIIIKLKNFIPEKEFIERDEVFKLSKGGDLSKLTRNETQIFEAAKNKYEELINFIQTDQFFEDAKLKITPNITVNQQEIRKEKVKWWQKILRIFASDKHRIDSEIVVQNSVLEKNLTEEGLRNFWCEFKDSFKVTEKVIKFCDFVNENENELNDIKKAIEDFKLTESLKIQSLIDKRKLEEFQKLNSSNLLNKIIEKFKLKNEHSFKKSLKEIFNTAIADFIQGYKFIDWETFDKGKSDKFSFIVDLNAAFTTKSVNHIEGQSVPFVTYEDIAPESAKGKITKLLYIGNHEVIQKINDRIEGVQDILDLNSIIGYQSTHIENKLCMFQIQPIENIDYLCDCHL